MRFLLSPAFRYLGLGIGLLTCVITLMAAPAPDAGPLFKEKCSMCHGADGKGFAAIKTPDFTDPKWQASMTDKEITEVITNGKKGTPMPAFGGKLSGEEIQNLVAFIRSLDSSKKK